MRERNHWGWGFTDRFPDDASRRALAQQIGALLGVPPPALLPLPPADDLRMPPTRVAVPAALAGFARADDDASRARCTYGRGYLDQWRGFRGDFAAAPDVVARPRDAGQIERVLEWAGRERLWIVPFGGGTSVVRGVEAIGGREVAGVIALDVGALDRVLEVDAVSRAARVQAGVLGPALEAQLEPHGLSLRFFPQSFELSSLGGWIATRAGGHYATLHTHIDDLVESVTMLTPRGAWRSRRLPASGAGPSPDRLILGSEGAFGVITEAWLRVVPRPRWRASAGARFHDWSAAVAAVRAIAQSGLHPANCRLLDKREAQLNLVAGGGEHVLLLGFESADHPVGAWIERALQLAAGEGGKISPPVLRDDGANERATEAGSWRDAFLFAPYLQSALISLGIVADTFETACTWDRFDTLHAEVNERVRGALAQYAGGGVLTCRFTHVYADGPAPYYTFIAPGRGRRTRAMASDPLRRRRRGAVGRRHDHPPSRGGPVAPALVRARGAAAASGSAACDQARAGSRRHHEPGCPPRLTPRAQQRGYDGSGQASRASALLIRLLQDLDVQLGHLEHGRHHAFRFRGILVLQHRAQDSGNDLPGHSESVLEPAALLCFATLGELGPQLIDFLLRLAVNEERDGW